MLAYMFLLLFWADFYYHLTNEESDLFKKRRIELVAATIVFILINLAFTIILFTWGGRNPHHDLWVDDIWALLSAVIFIGIAFGFLMYGTRLHRFMSQMGERKASQAQLIVIVGTVCTVCFLFRAAVMIFSAAKNAPWENEGDEACFNLTQWFTFIYFFFSELVPIAMMMFLLRSLPKSGYISDVNEHENHSGQLNYGGYAEYPSHYGTTGYLQNFAVNSPAKPVV